SSAFSAVRLPGMTATTRRCSGSSATWSRQSPLRASAGSSGSQCFSSATKAHSSSNWASRVLGGNGDQLVVQGPRVGPGLPPVGGPRFAMPADESAGLAQADPFGEVVHPRDGRLIGQVRAEERRPLALGEAGLAGAAAEQPPRLAGAVAVADGQISRAA